MFADRAEAGRRLAALLSIYADATDAIVLGIPRGGAMVAGEVARELHLPLDIVLAAKVGAPGNPEFAVGALTADGELLANPSAGLSETELAEIAGDAHAKIGSLAATLRGGRDALSLAEKTAIVVDDGLATGLTAQAAIRYLRRQGAAKIVLAVPVASAEAASMLARDADEVVVIDRPKTFFAVGQFYRHFTQTEDWEVSQLLASQRVSP
jgi:putative phosphoribosyl transferase